jgi:hypothetical protein
MAPITLFDITVLPFVQALNNLSAILEKGQLHAAGKDDILLKASLISDMEGLAFQIQCISDTAEGFAVRLGVAELVPREDDKTTIPQIQERIKKTIASLKAISPESLNGANGNEIVMKSTVPERKMTGTEFVVNFVIPNFYFHESMAYAILRKEGVQIGKSDFLGI